MALVQIAFEMDDTTKEVIYEAIAYEYMYDPVMNAPDTRDEYVERLLPALFRDRLLEGARRKALNDLSTTHEAMTVTLV